MEEILFVILQGLLEFALEVLVNLPLNGITCNGSSTTVSHYLLWFCVGCLVAVASLILFPHSLIVLSQLRIVNVLLAPVISGCMSRSLAAYRQSQSSAVAMATHFWQAYWFTLGLVLIRFAFATTA